MSGGFNHGLSYMNRQQLDDCMGHLEAAEALMVDANDLAGLTRLSLVIEMLRRANGLPDRPIDMAEFASGSVYRVQESPR
jgi:hypothetical protein